LIEGRSRRWHKVFEPRLSQQREFALWPVAGMNSF
jgi:hypothetical protein